jgi:hypothetical protein
MTRLGGAIEQLEATSPYLIPQNQELISSYRTAVSSALDRGFDFKQQAIDTRLSKMGLSNSSTALGMQIALAREKANAMAEAELKQAELAQGLKQQAIGNLMNRGKLMNDQANTELARFDTETGKQIQQRGQDIQREIAQGTLEQDRQKFLTAAGLDAMNAGNQQAINAGAVDANRVAGLNNAQYQRYSMTSNPMREMLGAFTTAGAGALGKGIINKFLPIGEQENK